MLKHRSGKFDVSKQCDELQDALSRAVERSRSAYFLANGRSSVDIAQSSSSGFCSFNYPASSLAVTQPYDAGNSFSHRFSREDLILEYDKEPTTRRYRSRSSEHSLKRSTKLRAKSISAALGTTLPAVTASIIRPLDPPELNQSQGSLCNMECNVVKNQHANEATTPKIAIYTGSSGNTSSGPRSPFPPSYRSTATAYDSFLGVPTNLANISRISSNRPAATSQNLDTTNISINQYISDSKRLQACNRDSSIIQTGPVKDQAQTLQSRGPSPRAGTPQVASPRRRFSADTSVTIDSAILDQTSNSDTLNHWQKLENLETRIQYFEKVTVILGRYNTILIMLGVLLLVVYLAAIKSDNLKIKTRAQPMLIIALALLTIVVVACMLNVCIVKYIGHLSRRIVSDTNRTQLCRRCSATSSDLSTDIAKLDARRLARSNRASYMSRLSSLIG